MENERERERDCHEGKPRESEIEGGSNEEFFRKKMDANSILSKLHLNVLNLNSFSPPLFAFFFLFWFINFSFRLLPRAVVVAFLPHSKCVKERKMILTNTRAQTHTHTHTCARARDKRERKNIKKIETKKETQETVVR